MCDAVEANRIVAVVQAGFMFVAVVCSGIAVAGGSDYHKTMEATPWTVDDMSYRDGWGITWKETKQYTNFWGRCDEMRIAGGDWEWTCSSWDSLGADQQDKADSMIAFASLGFAFAIATFFLVSIKICKPRQAPPLDFCAFLTGLIGWSFILACWALATTKDWKPDGAEWSVGFGCSVTAWFFLSLTLPLFGFTCLFPFLFVPPEPPTVKVGGDRA